MFRLARKEARKWTLEERKALLDQAKIAVMSVCTPLKIYAFGSVTADCFDDSSDLDLIVVFETETEAAQSWRLHSKIRKNLKWPLDLFAFSSKKFDEKKESGGIAFVAFNEGWLIFESKSQAF